MEECVWELEDRTMVLHQRERTMAVGGEPNHFGRKRIYTGGDIFILLKDINNGSQLELLLITHLSAVVLVENHC
jgi:hypothetical protein